MCGSSPRRVTWLGRRTEPAERPRQPKQSREVPRRMNSPGWTLYPVLHDAYGVSSGQVSARHHLITIDWSDVHATVRLFRFVLRRIEKRLPFRSRSRVDPGLSDSILDFSGMLPNPRSPRDDR